MVLRGGSISENRGRSPIRLTTTSTRPSPSRSPNAAPRFQAGPEIGAGFRGYILKSGLPEFASSRFGCRELRWEYSSTLLSIEPQAANRSFTPSLLKSNIPALQPVQARV